MVSILMIVSAAFMAFGGLTGSGGSRSATEPALSTDTSHATTSGASGSAAGAASARDQSILSELEAKGVPSWAIHPPDFSAAAEDHTGQVGLTYSEAPAPMGVSDLGLVNESGQIVPYEVNTSSVEGSIAFTDAQSVYADGDGPNMFGVQMNSVDAGVTLFGNSSNYFWTQNFVSYTPSTGWLVFGDNIWNFSNPEAYISPNVFYAHGPNGTLYSPIYYYAIGPTFTIHYPFTVTFYNNVTVLDDRPAVFFNYTVSNATRTVSGSYDYVIFNSTAGTPTSAAPSGAMQIDGYEYNPVGLPSDVELVVVGNDDGDTTSFYAMNATEVLDLWNSTTRTYQPIRSAVDVGSETGETSDGIAVYFETGSSVAHLALGPSFLGGLWNVSSASGERTYELTLTPTNAFLFADPGAAFNPSTAQWIPTFGATTQDIVLPGAEALWLEAELSEYVPLGAPAPGGANTTLTVDIGLTPSDTAGVYTPLIADGNAELAAISSSGAGTAVDPYVIENNEYGEINAEFDAWNDFQFPVFPGLLLFGTTDYVDVTPPSFAITYPAWQLETIYSTGLPATNDLQVQFWNVSHVLLDGGSLSGWLSFELTGFPEGSVLFWNSSDNVVASNTFLDEGVSLTLFGGSNNTVWGNRFLAVAAGGSIPDEVLDFGPDYAEGINETDSGDLIYNNYFDVPFPAITPTYNPLSCQINCSAAVYTDTWNVTDQPASDYSIALGVNLTGSIIGTTYQGGNFWSIYGLQGNPYGVLPFNDSGLVTVGGDYVPLIPFAISEAEFFEQGLASGVAWGIYANDVNYTTTSHSVAVWGPNGTYPYSVLVPTGYTVSGYGYFTLNGTLVTVEVYFVALGWVAGSVSPADALLVVNGTDIPLGATGTFNVSLVPGTYPVYASASDYLPYYTNVTVKAEQGTSLAIAMGPSTTTTSPSPSSSPAISSEAWGIIGALAAVAVILAITTVVFARRRGPPPSPVTPYSPGPPGGAQ